MRFVIAAIGVIEYRVYMGVYVYAVSNACLNKGVRVGGRRRCVPRHENSTDCICKAKGLSGTLRSLSMHYGLTLADKQASK